MTGNLDQAIKTLLVQALPALFGGATPAVQATVTGDLFAVDPHSADPVASEPRPDDHTDDLPFDPAQPQGPYLLTQEPDPGPRRVRLTSALGDRIALTGGEVAWDANDARRFTLALRPDRGLQGIDGVQVLYSVVAVYTGLKTTHDFTLKLQSNDASRLERAEALAIALIAINRAQLIEDGRDSFSDGDYGAQIEIKSFRLVNGSSPAADTRLLHFSAEIELKATRALGADEGRPIQRIRTASRPLDPQRPIDIFIDVEG